MVLFFQEVGYQHGKTVFGVWCRSGVLDKMLKDRQETCKSKTSDVSAQFKCTPLQELLYAQQVVYCPEMSGVRRRKLPQVLSCEPTSIS